MERIDDIMGYDALDSTGRKIGRIDNVWVDERTNEAEFIGVKTGWLFGRTHAVPAHSMQVDNEHRAVILPYDEARLRDAPSHPDEATSLDDTSSLYGFYGVDRMSRGRESLAEGEEERIPLAEERMRVGKREVEEGGLRLRKVVRTERVSEPVDLKREELHVERVPATEERLGGRAPEGAFEEREIEMRAVREEPIVDKEVVSGGEVRAYKTQETERRNVEGEVRREDVEIDREREGRLTRDRERRL